MPVTTGTNFGNAMSALVKREVKAGSTPELGWIGRQVLAAIPASVWITLITLALKLLIAFPGLPPGIGDALAKVLDFLGIFGSPKATDSTWANIDASLQEAGL